ncbi:MAG: hypothetical protein Tsb0034_19850 [Ekhidna sp.]
MLYLAFTESYAVELKKERFTQDTADHPDFHFHLPLSRVAFGICRAG